MCGLTQPRHHRRRCPGRRHEAKPTPFAELLKTEFTVGGHIGQQAAALRGQQRQGSQASSLDVGQRGGQVVGECIHLPCQRVVERWPRALVRHMQELNARQVGEILHIRVPQGAYTGIGSLGHANVENFAHLAGIQLLHVPYKGAGPALNDALAGQVDALTDNLPSALPHIQAGRLRALALLSPQRSSLLPDVPTYRELGFEELSEGGWFGLMAPAGTPPAVVARLREAAHRAMEDASFKAQADKIGGVSMANTPDEFAQQIKQALARYQRVARVANIQPE